MAADCRISEDQGEIGESRYTYTPHRSERTRWRLKRSSLLSLAIVIVLLGELFSPVCSLILNCDSVKNCLCGRNDEGGWRIECPNDFRSQYPIELIVQRPDANNYNEALLVVQCNGATNKIDPWSYIKGIDLSLHEIHAKVVWLEVKYCPLVKDGWNDLLKKLNLTGEDILRFSFITDDPSDNATNLQIPTNFFEKMPNIEVLNLRKNKLSDIPDLSSLKNLKRLNMRQNELTKVPSRIFSKNTQLTNIAFTSNKITTVEPEAFPDSVEHLEINNNEISSLNSKSFSNLKNLTRLFLNSNPLENLDPNTFDGMTALEELLLYNTRMTQFPDFKDLPRLANLTISNAIRYRYIQKDGEDVTTTLAPDYLPENILVLKNLSSLQNLIIPLNHFTSLPVLENLPKLVSIDLKRNEITEILSGAFSGLPSLKVVNLSKNKLKTLGQIKTSSLIELDVSQNFLTELRNDTFAYLNLLKKLNLARNQIGDVTHKTFEPLAFLEEIDLSYNQLTFSNSPYSNVKIRDDFNLFGDPSNRSPLKSSLNLKRIYLGHNKIEKLGFSDWSQTFIAIQEIDLQSNQISRITANELNFISSNLTLNLENNRITTVDMTLSQFFLDDNAAESKEMRVLLNGNPLTCDCLAYGLKAFSSESYELRIKGLACNEPPEFKNRKLIEVSNDQLVCTMEKEKGCPELCSCRERTVDKTVLVDCSGKNLTSEEVPKLDTFKGIYGKWMIELNLSDNEITEFNNTSYMKQFLNKTKHINLTGNNLTTTLFLERVSDYQPTTFALADNPFPCESCIGFQIPWRAFPTRISDLGNVTCRKPVYTSSNKKYELLYIQENSKEFEKYCAAPKISAVLVGGLVIAVIVLSCLCASLFVTIRYGWAIKAYLYSKGWYWCLFWERDMDDEEDEKLYDAFVSYSHKDEDWVLDELVSRLETNDGFKLCLHYRDWIPGDWIPDQIVRSVDKSRRTIVILSKNFVESVWSKLEFKAAHAQALKERSNRVILILLGEELKEGDVQDDELKMYMKMNTFMKFDDPLFWARLKYALPHKKSSSHPTEDEQKHNAINKMQQRERAIKLDKLRAKLEQNV